MLTFAWDGPWRPGSAFFQSVVDATGVSRERVSTGNDGYSGSNGQAPEVRYSGRFR